MNLDEQGQKIIVGEFHNVGSVMDGLQGRVHSHTMDFTNGAERHIHDWVEAVMGRIEVLDIQGAAAIDQNGRKVHMVFDTEESKGIFLDSLSEVPLLKELEQVLESKGRGHEFGAAYS